MLSSLPAEILKGIRLTLVFGLVTGIIYPLAITGISQVVFNQAANGSLVNKNGQIVGSNSIGQQFTQDKYFHGRPSATVDPATGSPKPYAAENSTGSNLGPSNQVLINRVASDVRAFQQANGLDANTPVPVDIVTTDFSGFDPDITEAAALLQVNRVAQARNLDPAKVHGLVEKYVHGRVLWIFGQAYVNVLEINMALDAGEAG